MQSTGVLNLVIGLTDVKKKNAGPPVIYLSRPRTQSPSLFSLHAAAHPFALAHAAAHPRHRSRPFHAAAVARSTCRRPEPPPHVFLAAARPHRSASSAARVRRPPAPPARASTATCRRVSPRRPHALRAAAPTRQAAHAAAPPSLSHDAATAASRTQTVRGFARATFRSARAPRSCLRQ